jgi:integrase
MRIGEILSLKKNDIDWTKDPVWINIRGETTKTGDPRTVYLSDEAKIYLHKWINEEHDDYFKNIKQRVERLSEHKNSANGRLTRIKDMHQHDDGRLFPITRQTAEAYWQTMLKRANLDQRDPSTNMRVLHLHTTRKFFRTMMIKPLGVDVCEAILGHKGYLTDAYRRYSKDDLARLYKENQKHVTIIKEPVDIDKLEKTMDSRLQEKEADIQRLKLDFIEAKLRSQDMEKEISEMKKLLGKNK